MEYPEVLYQNGREKVDKDAILESHYLYARHKPGYDWNEAEGLPDYNKIKINPDSPEKNQSFNWEQYSEPHWVRFKSEKIYLKDYAVVGYLAGTLKHIEKNIDDEKSALSDLINVEHEPIEINYSHCQISCTDKFKKITTNKKSIKRALRMAIRHQATVFLKPNEEFR